MDARRVEASLSYLMIILLRDPSHAENLSMFSFLVSGYKSKADDCHKRTDWSKKM
jgi:hypothetical protein